MGDLCSASPSADPCCDRHKCKQIHGVGARCIDAELWSSLDAASGIDSPFSSSASNPSTRSTSAPSNQPTHCVPLGDLCSVGPSADPCCDRHKCKQIHGIGARCIDVELWSSLDAANGIDSDEVKLLRVDRRGGTPIQLLSTPETSGANGSFAKKSVSTKILSLVISIVALVACVLLLAKEIYKFINEERKSGSIDNSISSMFMSGSSVENIQEKEGGSIDGMFMPGSSAEENQEPGLDTIDRYDIEGRTVSIPVG